MNKFLIIGLGNIGVDYEHTRHNIGFDVVDAFVKKHESSFKLERLASVSEIRIKGRSVFCIKPTTFMNLSGNAVRYWVEKEKISLENCLIILDDVALPIEKVRLRPSGSDGGHNGLKSITEVMQTDKYPRLRIGIGNHYPKGRQVEYVLGRWNPTELPLISHKVTKCAELIESFVLRGIAQTMNEYNNLVFTL
jgi:PTH1 family peptidyl-tRNA hydrolase